jgi:uncharacterized protein DUF6064
MTLPFSAREFLELFGRYNAAVWPAQLVLYGIAALIVILVVQQERPRLVLALLATLWLWSGLAYHLVFFSAINAIAPLFGIMFVAQAVILLWVARGPAAGAGGAQHQPVAVHAGKVLVAYALIGYPLLGYVAGHRYPETPTFGAPCPTTIFTLGVLLWARCELSWWIVAIPVAWTIIGTSAALQLSVPQDFGLAIAGLTSLTVLAYEGTQRLETRRPDSKRVWPSR